MSSRSLRLAALLAAVCAATTFAFSTEDQNVQNATRILKRILNLTANQSPRVACLTLRNAIKSLRTQLSGLNEDFLAAVETGEATIAANWDSANSEEKYLRLNNSLRSIVDRVTSMPEHFTDISPVIFMNTVEMVLDATTKELLKYGKWRFQMQRSYVHSLTARGHIPDAYRQLVLDAIITAEPKMSSWDAPAEALRAIFELLVPNMGLSGRVALIRSVLDGTAAARESQENAKDAWIAIKFCTNALLQSELQMEPLDRILLGASFDAANQMMPSDPSASDLQEAYSVVRASYTELLSGDGSAETRVRYLQAALRADIQAAGHYAKYVVLRAYANRIIDDQVAGDVVDRVILQSAVQAVDQSLGSGGGYSEAGDVLRATFQELLNPADTAQVVLDGIGASDYPERKAVVADTVDAGEPAELVRILDPALQAAETAEGVGEADLILQGALLEGWLESVR